MYFLFYYFLNYFLLFRLNRIIMSFLWGLFRIYLNYFRCAHFTHTRTHMHSNTRRETRTHIGFFTAPICIRGVGRVVSVYPVYPLARTEPKLRVCRHRRRRPATSNSIDTMSPEHIGKVLTTAERKGELAEFSTTKKTCETRADSPVEGE